MSHSLASLREEAFEANREIAMLGLAILTWGNASAFDPESGMFAIKPSGVDYRDLKPGSMVVVDLQGRIVEGALKPSSDMRTHLVLYRTFKGIRGICHSHSPHAVAWAQARRDIPCLGTTHADQVAGPVPCTPMISEAELAGDYELATGELIARFFLDKDPLQVSSVLVAGHGPFSWGSGAMDSVHKAAALEEVARMAMMTLAIDPDASPLPAYVTRKHWERKHGPAAYYGQG